jgi:hypothetical protein
MKILDKAVELEKALLRRFGRRSDIKRHPIEVYRAVLDEIEEASEAGVRGTRIFPYNQISITIATTSDHMRATAEAVFAEAPSVEERLRTRLQQRGCSLTDRLSVSVKFVDGTTTEWTGREYRVDLRRKTTSRQPEKPVRTAPPAPQELHLTVVTGATVKPRYSFHRDRINLGRLADVLDRQQRVVRQNQVVFEDHHDEICQSVSRAHAHVVFDATTGDARIHDDGSTHGTRVVRAGRTIEVPRGAARGIKLKDGDELLLGQARMRVEFRPLRPVKTGSNESSPAQGR